MVREGGSSELSDANVVRGSRGSRGSGCNYMTGKKRLSERCSDLWDHGTSGCWALGNGNVLALVLQAAIASHLPRSPQWHSTSQHPGGWE